MELHKYNLTSYLYDVFSGYVKNTITLIRPSFPVPMLNKGNVQPLQINSPVSSFMPATVEEVRQKVYLLQIHFVI